MLIEDWKIGENARICMGGRLAAGVGKGFGTCGQFLHQQVV